MSARFITFEGGEGAGKSTQVKRLAEALRAKGRDVVVTREPGGTPNAERIRSLVVEGATDTWLPASEMLLYLAARYDHIERLIKPALAAGKDVICDRFIDSTIAYQGWGHGLDIKQIVHFHTLIGAIEPDITFLLDIPVTAGIQRAASRHKADSSAEDRYERLDTHFHERVRKGFLDIAKHHPKRCVVVDAAQSPDAVAQQIILALAKHRKE